MNIFYKGANFNSFRRGREAYCNLIRDHELLKHRHQIVPTIEAADVVLLQLLPFNYAALYKTYPILKSKYVIARCVWETDELPESYKRSISYVQEIWTPSRYSGAAFEKCHPRVLYMPHMISRSLICSDEDRKFIRKIVAYSKDRLYYLSISKFWDTRKNLKFLVEAFRNQRKYMPNASLIIKADPRDNLPTLPDPRIILVNEHLTWGQINALYEICHAYVSPHHSEGWGWTLSDALLFRKPIIGTGYSGNMEFMNSDNSFVLDYVEDYIRPEDTWNDTFTTTMRWAYPNQTDLQDKLLALYLPDSEMLIKEKVSNQLDLSRFEAPAIAQLLRNRLDSIECSAIDSFDVAYR